MNDLSLREVDVVSFTEDDRAFVFAVARRIVHDEDDAADVAQDALLTAFRHRASFRGASRYRTWLYRIAVTSALSHLRRCRQRKVDATRSLDNVDAGALDLPTTHPSPEAELATAEIGALARLHLDRLDPKYASVLRLRLDDDLAEAEVARALGLSVATVKIRGFRARAALRSTLAAAL